MSKKLIPPTPGLPPCIPPICKIFNMYHRKKINKNYVEFDFSVGTVRVIFSFFWTNNAPCPPLECPTGPLIFQIFHIHRRKKYVNENYVEFDFSICTVLVIFSFFWTDNDLVCAPPPSQSPVGRYPNTTIMHILCSISQKLLARFSWNFGKFSKQYKGN